MKPPLGSGQNNLQTSSVPMLLERSHPPGSGQRFRQNTKLFDRQIGKVVSSLGFDCNILSQRQALETIWQGHIFQALVKRCPGFDQNNHQNLSFEDRLAMKPPLGSGQNHGQTSSVPMLLERSHPPGSG